MLVGGLEHLDYVSIYLGIMLPTDELHHFSRWLLHHQPVLVDVVPECPVVDVTFRFQAPSRFPGAVVARCGDVQHGFECLWQSLRMAKVRVIDDDKRPRILGSGCSTLHVIPRNYTFFFSGLNRSPVVLEAYDY